MIFFSAEAISDSQRVYEFLELKNPGAAARAMGMPWGEVKAWMESWGTAKELPAPKAREL